MRVLGFIIKKIPVREHDLLVSCYTRELGKITAIARGALKATSIQGQQLDQMNLVSFDLIIGRNMPIIAGAQCENAFRGIRSSLISVSTAYFFLEVIDKMVFDNELDEKLFGVLHQTMKKLDLVPGRQETLADYRRGQLDFLNVLGYLPRTDRCVLCSDDADRGGALNFELGGIICTECFALHGRGELLSRRELDMLRQATDLAGGSRSVLDDIFEYTSGCRFSSIDMVYNTGAFGSV